MKFLTVLSAFFVFSTAAYADLIEDVRCREIGFSKSIESQDLAGFASFIDADARFVGSGVTKGPEAIAEAWSVFVADSGPRIKWRPQIVEVLQDGKLALSRGPYRINAIDPEGNEIEQWGTFNSVWRLHADGQWRVVFDAGSPAAEAPAEEVRALLDQVDSCS